MNSQLRTRRWIRWWVGAYVVLVGLMIGLMIWARQSMVAQLSTPDSISDWQAWKADVHAQQGRTGPVERRVPKSDEPPALVLLRDYFGVLVVGALVFGSMLYWIMAWFVTGIVQK